LWHNIKAALLFYRGYPKKPSEFLGVAYAERCAKKCGILLGGVLDMRFVSLSNWHHQSKFKVHFFWFCLPPKATDDMTVSNNYVVEPGITQ
jgi:hypothetical protein